MSYDTVLKSILMAGALIAGAPAMAAEDAETPVDVIPKIHGVVRARYEAETADGWRQRFEVRNARLSVEGNVIRRLSYLIRIDACDQGVMKFLDAYAQWNFDSPWQIRAGQFRVPWAIETFRAPGTYIFANRSFLGRDMANVREVGVQGSFTGTKTLPLTVEAGLFNSKPMANHNVWQDALDVAVKAVWKPGHALLSASYLSMKPYGVRMNLVDATAGWEQGRWTAQAEYQHKHYEHADLDATDAWGAWASYALPLRKCVFNTLSFQGRYDAMTDNSNGSRASDGTLSYNQAKRQRLTLGATLDYVKSPLRAAVRLNYEKYFYEHRADAAVGADDKIVAEIVVKF